jgi:tetratricopeptide (TPR) repeat protein
VRAAQRGGCHDRTWQLAYLLFSYFYAAGQAREWLDTLRIGMRSAELVEDRRAQVVLLNHMSVAHSRMGENDAAVGQLQRGLRMLEDLGDDMLLTSLLGNMASTLREAKRYAEALPYAARALNLAQHSGLDYYAAGCLDVLCELHAELGAFENSLWYGRFGLTAARRCRNALLEANILINLGAAEFGLGHAEAAVGCFQDALSLCERTGDHYHEGLALFGLAKLERAAAGRGRPAAARQLAERALLRLADLDAEEVADVREFVRALEEEPPQQRHAAAPAGPDRAGPDRAAAEPPADPVVPRAG